MMIRVISFFLLFFPWFSSANASLPAEVQMLKTAFEKEVARTVPNDAYKKFTKVEIRKFIKGNPDFSSPQYAIFVDRNPGVQTGSVVYINPAANRITIIGVFPVSTGNPHRRGFFETPEGVFRNSPEIMDYRALGTKNSKGWRGLGKKGSRVWDFGWQKTELADGKPFEIRLLMHATDPNFGEPRLGKVDSKGCVRIPAKVNAFLDKYGIIDASYEDGSARAKSVLLRDREPVRFAGQYLIVGDSRS
ncbi:MAG TPA: L,D-transpeptidase family protein [Candidatus Paceibacterota bacterium]|nr:L,D-transpeptidase family protein [Candidatus Paceibacterota bacterium]